MASLHGELLDALEALDSAAAGLRDQMRTIRKFVVKRRALIEQNRSVTDGADPIGFGSLRAGNEDALQAFDLARQRARQLEFRLAAAQGLSIAEIARRWQVSRQRVSRVLNHEVIPPRGAGRSTPRVGS